MKINLTISLDKEIVEWLKEMDGYSGFVNKQMKAVYDVVNCENLEILSRNLLKTKQILKEGRKERRDLMKKIKKIKEKQAKVIKICRGMDADDFKLLKKCKSLFSLASIHRGGALKKYNWIEIKKIYNSLEGGGGNV